MAVPGLARSRRRRSEDVDDVCPREDDAQFEGDLRRVRAIQLSASVSLAGLVLEEVKPLPLIAGHQIVDTPRSGPELGRGGHGKKSPPGKTRRLRRRGSPRTVRAAALCQARSWKPRARTISAMKLSRGGLDSRELQLLLRAEQHIDAALGHSRRLGEPADRQAVQAFDRGQPSGMFQDPFSRPFPRGTTPRRGGLTSFSIQRDPPIRGLAFYTDERTLM